GRPKYTVIPLADGQEFQERVTSARTSEVCIDLRPLRHRCKDQFDCCEKNPDRLVLELPILWRNTLREGSIYTLSDKTRYLNVWRPIIHSSRGRLTGGMRVLTRDCPAKEFYRDLRYSAGVAELHRRGLQLRPFAGGTEVFIEEPAIGGSRAARGRGSRELAPCGKWPSSLRHAG